MLFLALGILLPLRAQAVPPQQLVQPATTPIQTVDEALDRLPPTGQESTWDTAKGHWNLDPSVAWMHSYIAGGGTLTDEQWRRSMQRSAIDIRTRWPVHEFFAIGLEVPYWLPETEIRLVSTNRSLWCAEANNRRGGCGNCSQAARSRERYQVLGLLDVGPQTLAFDVVIVRYSPFRGLSLRKRDTPTAEGPPVGVLWSGALSFQVEGVQTLESALPTVHNEEINAYVRKLIVASFWDDLDRLLVGADFDAAPQLSNTALSFELTLFRSGEEHESRAFVALPRPKFLGQGVSWDLTLPQEEASQWSIRVRGHSTDVLRNWDATCYWDGELSIPLTDVERLR